jgi:simple sugar transport system substrate-binding protein
MKSRKRIIAGLVAVAALTAAGCSSSGGKQTTAGASDTAPMTVAMITFAAPGDTFWDVVRQGAEEAAARHNIKFQYSSDPQVGNQSTLVQNAIDQKVDGIALAMANPEGLKGAIDKAKAAGIPVVGFNSGLPKWRDVGVLEYFGTDESLAGKAFGERLTTVGAKKALCVIMEQGHIALETRCAALKTAFTGTTEIIYVNGANMPDVEAGITAKLQQDKSIDYVVTLGAQFALTALKSVGAAGSTAKVATFDTNKDLVAKIKDGSVQWAVDQQPYLQGYLPLQSLWLYKTNGNIIGGGSEPVLTGPAFIDQSNIDAVAEFAAKGTR